MCADPESAADGGHLILHTKVAESYGSIQRRDSDDLSTVSTASEGSDLPNVLSRLRRRMSSGFAGEVVPTGAWVLFNDFSVSITSVDEARDFRSRCRNPCVVMFRAASASADVASRGSDAGPCPITADVFKAKSISRSPASARRAPTFKQLPLDKLPGEGAVVAIDCEFVALSTEKYHVDADGTKVVDETSQKSLARVSCLTGEGVVFIDDYILTPEPVVDYLTRYSGLVHGDLDPQTSPHHLLPLKTAYMKLRHLVDRGCVFVGHGLSSDFRMINVFVPPEQVMDTVELFWIKGRRKLSLKFLTSYF